MAKTWDSVSVFQETKTMGDLSFQYAFKVNDQWDNVDDLATQMLFTNNLPRLVKDSYADNLIYSIDLADIKQVLN